MPYNEREPEESLNPNRELSRRLTQHGYEITLWWVRGTIHTFVTIDDCRELESGQREPRQIVVTPEGESPNQVFKHPFAYIGQQALSMEPRDGRGTE